MVILRILLYLAAAYAVIVAVLWYFQTSLLFPASLAESHAPKLPAEARRLEVGTPDGERLVGTYLAPEGEGTGRLLVLGFGGNAWNADGVALYLHGVFPDAHTVAFHYRGYRPSTGRPSAAALLRDGLQVHAHAVRRIGPERVVAVGFSLGTGVAAYLSAHRSLDGLILTSPFDSLTAVARDHYPWIPVGLLFRHPMPTSDFIARRPTPTAVIVAERDRIIPPARADALLPAIERLEMHRRIAGAGHNDLAGRAEYQAAMREALRRVLAPRPPSP